MVSTNGSLWNGRESGVERIGGSHIMGVRVLPMLPPTLTKGGTIKIIRTTDGGDCGSTQSTTGPVVDKVDDQLGTDAIVGHDRDNNAVNILDSGQHVDSDCKKPKDHHSLSWHIKRAVLSKSQPDLMKTCLFDETVPRPGSVPVGAVPGKPAKVSFWNGKAQPVISAVMNGHRRQSYCPAADHNGKSPTKSAMKQPKSPIALRGAKLSLRPCCFFNEDYYCYNTKDVTESAKQMLCPSRSVSPGESSSISQSSCPSEASLPSQSTTSSQCMSPVNNRNKYAFTRKAPPKPSRSVSRPSSSVGVIPAYGETWNEIGPISSEGWVIAGWARLLFIEYDNLSMAKLRFHVYWYIDGLVQDCSNSIALALELLQSCIKQSI